LYENDPAAHTVTVRPRRDADLERCVALVRAIHVSDRHPSTWPEDPVRWIAPNRTIAAWVSEERDELTGHLALTAPDPERDWPQWREAFGLASSERLAVMRRLFVAPGWRRRGIATSLIRCAEREAARRGLHPVFDISDDNHAAIAFWEAHGWRQVGEARLPAPEGGAASRLLLFVAPR
jgi:GNAT superfamily N-acetyltransferase